MLQKEFGFCEEYTPQDTFSGMGGGGAYSSQQDFCPIEESAPQELPDNNLLINTFASVLIIFCVDKYICDKQNSDARPDQTMS